MIRRARGERRTGRAKTRMAGQYARARVLSTHPRAKCATPSLGVHVGELRRTAVSDRHVVDDDGDRARARRVGLDHAIDRAAVDDGRRGVRTADRERVPHVEVAGRGEVLGTRDRERVGPGREIDRIRAAVVVRGDDRRRGACSRSAPPCTRSGSRRRRFGRRRRRSRTPGGESEHADERENAEQLGPTCDGHARAPTPAASPGSDPPSAPVRPRARHGPAPYHFA